MLDFIHSGMTRSSIYDSDFLELVWENGQVVVKGGSSNRAQKTPNSCKGYSISPPHKETTIDHEDACITKKTRLSTLYSLFDHFPSQRDSHMSSSHQSNGHDSSKFLQTKNSFKLNEEFANLLRPEKDSKKVTTGNNNSHLCTYPSQPSCPVPKKQKTDSSNQTTPATNSHNFGCDQRARKVNFSNFSIPAVFLKSTSYHGKSATEPTKYARVEEIEASKVEKAEAVESAKGSDIGLKGIQKQTPFVERRVETPHDEHSEAIRIHRSYGQPCNQTSNSEALRAKGKANKNTNLGNEPLLASSSVCSLGASNDPNFGTRRHEDTDESTYFYLSDNDGEAEDVVKQTPDREDSRVKRSRNPEVHNLSEKKRREKINKKICALKELIPNCKKVDKASVLDDAIDYLKTLKLQLQIMSMGNGLWPLMNMMLPAAAHHMNGPHLMGFRPPQFPIPPLSAITDNRFHHMFGFNNQIPQMPIPHAPFFPIMPNSNSTQPHLATSTATTTTTNLGEHLPNSTPLHVSVPTSSHLHAKAENVAMQVPNQVSLHQHCTSPPAMPFIFPQ